MKITLILLVAACLHVTANSVAQTVTLSVKNERLEKVFEEVKKQTGYSFFYSSDVDLMKANAVTVNVNNATVKEVLDACFKNQPFTYAILEKVIVIKTKQVGILSSVRNILSPIDVTGVVINENGDPIAGVSVTVKGSSQATSTNNDGEFLLVNTDKNAVLEFTGANVEASIYNVEGKTKLLIKLISKINKLDEVQVIAYGTTTKRLNTGSVSTVKSADIEKQSITNPLLGLQGRVPGMEIYQGTGNPGSKVTIRIRGLNSINQGSDPLYVIDGVPFAAQQMPGLLTITGAAGSANGNLYYGSPFSYINPSDIESIDVLKDADATAIYGSRGANGVVLITTKKGKPGQIKININAQTGIGKVAHKLKMLNTQQYLDMRHEALRNDGITSIPTSEYDLVLWDTTRNTDWQKELIGGTAKYNDIQASVSGGNTGTQYFIGAGYHNETTVFPGDFSDQKESVRFNISNASPNKKFKILFSGGYTMDYNRLPTSDLTQLAIILAPDAPSLYKPDRSINWAPNSTGVSTWGITSNPAALLLNTVKSRVSNLVANMDLSYEILHRLEIKTSFGYFNIQTDDIRTAPIVSRDPSSWSIGNSLRSASYVTNNSRSWIIEPKISYRHKLFKGQLSVLVGSTFQQNTNNGQNLSANGFVSDLVLEDLRSAPTVSGISIQSVYKYNAIYGRVAYNLYDKYLVDFTARRDGSSRFGPANQFSNFGAVGAGWIFSKESIIGNNLRWLSFGKLRLSYGTSGNDQIGDYTFLDLYNSTSVTAAYQGATGYQQTRIFTPDLAWEESKKVEVGLELGFLKDRVVVTASFYRNNSSNQLTNYLLPSITGFTSLSKNLPAHVQNQGFEITLNTENIRSRYFKWATFFNFSVNQNKLLSVSDGMSTQYKNLVGYSLGTSFYYQINGIDKATGRFQFADNHGSSTLTPNTLTDRVLNYTSFPEFFGGLQNSISYKGFQLDFLFQFVKQMGQSYLLNVLPGYYSAGGYNQPTSVLNHWRSPGEEANYQKFTTSLTNGIYASYSQYAASSDFSWKDASYIRLKNLSLSKQLSPKWLKFTKLNNARIFFQAQNLMTFTNYQGLDPETKSILTLPPLRTLTFGIQVTI